MMNETEIVERALVQLADHTDLTGTWNLTQFYEKFWHDDANQTLPIAPTLLIYADLMITDDPRNRETAERIYKEHLKQEYEQY